MLREQSRTNIHTTCMQLYSFKQISKNISILIKCEKWNMVSIWLQNVHAQDCFMIKGTVARESLVWYWWFESNPPWTLIRWLRLFIFDQITTEILKGMCISRVDSEHAQNASSVHRNIFFRHICILILCFILYSEHAQMHPLCTGIFFSSTSAFWFCASYYTLSMLTSIFCAQEKKISAHLHSDSVLQIIFWACAHPSSVHRKIFSQ